VAAARPYGLDPSAIAPAYGLAESTLAVTLAPVGTGVQADRIDPGVLEAEGRAVPAGPGRRVRQLVRVGRPVAGTSLRIVDPRSGVPVGERTVGHIEIRGPSVVGHYWGDPPPPAGGWLRTGDLGYLAGGELVVCGRDKDVLFAAGRNVFPQDIEAVAAEVPGVRTGGVAAFGVPGGPADRLVVAVETRVGDPATVRRQVAAAVLGEVGLRPDDVVALPPGRLPKTSSGKLRRAEARRRYLSGQLGPQLRQRVPERNPL
jgi:fatty-acyl-CoA synthase